MHVGKWRAGLGAAGIVLSVLMAGAAPAAAGIQVPTIIADMPGAVPAGHNWGFNDFFPRTLTVTRGTTIQFVLEGFHTFTLLPTSISVAKDLRTNGIGQGDKDDTTLNPNGTTHANFRVLGLLPSPAGCGSAGTPCIFDGTSTVSEGDPLGNPSGPVAITISAHPGLYTFHCRIHPQMVGHLRVVADSAAAPSAVAAGAQVSSQLSNDIKAGKAAEAAANHSHGTQNADGTTTWIMHAGTETADGHVAILEMLPANLHVRPGDKVVWKVPGPNEPHTVTFPGDLGNEFQPMCENAGGTDSPATPNHIPPQGPADFNCNGGPLDEIELDGGNGVHKVTSTGAVADSGVLFAAWTAMADGVPPSAQRSTYGIRFTGAPGTYHYVCQIHQGMEGDITVHS